MDERCDVVLIVVHVLAADRGPAGRLGVSEKRRHLGAPALVTRERWAVDDHDATRRLDDLTQVSQVLDVTVEMVIDTHEQRRVARIA